MSKCDINIDFDRDDRMYRGGETVTGALGICVNQDLNCNGIKLTHFWKTHGRWNCRQRSENVALAGAWQPNGWP